MDMDAYLVLLLLRDGRHGMLVAVSRSDGRVVVNVADA